MALGLGGVRVKACGAALPCERLDSDRSWLSRSSGADALGELRLSGRARLEDAPRSQSRNLVLDGAGGELERELSALAQLSVVSGGAPVVLCEVTPVEHWPEGGSGACGATRRARLAQLSGGPSSELVLVLGAGWAAAGSAGVVDAAALERRLVEAVLGGPETSRCGLVGEIAVQQAPPSASERAAVRGAGAACATIASRTATRGPLAVVSLRESWRLDAPRPSASSAESEWDRWQRVLGAAVCVLNDFAAGGGRLSRLLLGGIVGAVPALSCAAQERALDSLAALLAARPDWTLLLESPGGAWEGGRMSLAAGFLLQRGLLSRLCAAPCLSLASELSALGGLGYSGAVLSARQWLSAAGVSAADASRLLGDSALELLGWYEPPAAAAPAARPRWRCDGPCGKDYPAKKEPFTRLTFRYCSQDCLQRHKEALGGAGETPNSRQGGAGPRGGPGSGWGIAVGSS